ncbi:MAG TPA: hypothetical protein VF329_10800 [Gammaproteobacteria bacterium]
MERDKHRDEEHAETAILPKEPDDAQIDAEATAVLDEARLRELGCEPLPKKK